MEHLRFEWDENKNATNQFKHGISFEEASTVFYDVNAILFDDYTHNNEEDRFLIIGYSEKAHLYIVSHCYRVDDIIRIISARKADKEERKYYKKYSGG